MALISFSCSSLLLACLLMVAVLQLPTSGVHRRLLQTIDCKGACGERCKAASRTNVCLRACGTCCARCNCVPPGTSGNKDVCPCYANMKTRGNKPKCP